VVRRVGQSQVCMEEIVEVEFSRAVNARSKSESKAGHSHMCWE
jgi:hypothetical protein